VTKLPNYSTNSLRGPIKPHLLINVEHSTLRIFYPLIGIMVCQASMLVSFISNFTQMQITNVVLVCCPFIKMLIENDFWSNHIL
jgi:hypothetical protein